MKKLIVILLVIFFYKLSFASACNSAQVKIVVTIVPDLYPQYISWSLHDALTNALVDTGGYVGDSLCVDTGRCLKFTIYDSDGYGICCLYGNGHYSVTMNGNLVDSGGRFSYFQSAFFNCAPGVNCTNPLVASLDTMTAPGPETWYTFVTDSNGIYQFSTCGLGNTCSTVIYIYNHCQNLLVDTSAEGTSYYNLDGCDTNQAFISAQLPAGQTYYVRIGQQDSSCAGQAIRWQIHYAGPITGCMDTNACNYNPLATVSDTAACLYRPSPLCPLPDLAANDTVMKTSLYLDSIVVGNSDCYVVDGCLNAYGKRYIIRYATEIMNVGNADYYLGVPDSSNPEFVYDLCHQHWHYIGYAEYLLIAENGQQKQTGFKDGFCVEDELCTTGIGKYGCANMGISAGCGDIYAPYYDCQWVDITDIDTGNYTILVGVNWRQLPDLLGHYEITYSNNWAQACVHVYYDSTGRKNFTSLSNCPPYTDCAGDTFGPAIKDCNGVCNGPTLMGDLNANGVQDSTDLLLYLTGITNETLHQTTCNDLNADGRVTVADAARLNACLRYKDSTITNYTNAQTGQHLCQFPYSLSDYLDTVTFSISGVNWQMHYLDISVQNPICVLMGYELKIHGITVDSVINLIESNYHPDIRYSSSGHITELSDEDSGLIMQINPVNFIRVYFGSVQDSNVCITSIVDVVNEWVEQVTGLVNDSCSSQVAGITAVQNEPEPKIMPNPTQGFLTVINITKPVKSASLSDGVGQELAINYSVRSGNLTTDISIFPAGFYFLRLYMENEIKVFKIIKY
jgi:hypothetical protein